MNDINNDNKSFLIITGLIILSIFIYISIINIFPNNSSDKYYSKNNNYFTNSKITYKNGKLNIYSSEKNISVCIKQTKSTPTINSICWKPMDNNYIEISAFSNKEYYIWQKNINNDISECIEYKTNK